MVKFIPPPKKIKFLGLLEFNLKKPWDVLILLGIIIGALKFVSVIGLAGILLPP